MRKINFNTFLSYIGIPMVILGGFAIIEAFVPFAAGSINAISWGIDIRFRPLFASLKVNYWDISILFEGPYYMMLYYQFFDEMTEMIYLYLFKEFIPVSVNFLGFAIFILGITTLIVAIIGSVKSYSLDLSIINLVSGILLIIITLLNIRIFKNKIFQDIITFEIFYDIPFDLVPFVNYKMNYGAGFIIGVIIGSIMVILSIIILIFAVIQRKK